MSWPVDGSTSGSFLWHSSCGAGPKVSSGSPSPGFRSSGARLS
jgi:hypothetical protein